MPIAVGEFCMFMFIHCPLQAVERDKGKGKKGKGKKGKKGKKGVSYMYISLQDSYMV